MKISVIEFKDPTGKRVYLRGVAVVTSVDQFREGVIQAFKELKVNELFLQLGVQDDPATYSKSIQQDIWSAYLDLAVEQAEIVNGRLVRVVDPHGQLVMNGARDVQAKTEG
jgi:hypothetical protein